MVHDSFEFESGVDGARSITLLGGMTSTEMNQ